MALFVVTHDTDRSPAEAWARLVDWPRHGEFVLLTSVSVPTPPPNGIGTVFLARTGIGRLGFDDPMEITAWDPPASGPDGRGHCRLEKRGRVALGWAELSVAPTSSGARATWREDIRIVRAPRLADGVTAMSSRLLFGRVLRRLLED